MCTPLANAAQSGADDPPPIKLTDGVPSIPRGDPARDRRRRLIEGADRAGERVEQPPPGLDDHGRGQILEAGRQGRTRPGV